MTAPSHAATVGSVTISSGDYILDAFTPKEPTKEADGFTWKPTVKEKIVVYVSTSTEQAAIDAIRDLEIELAQAARSQKNKDEALIYLTFTPDGSDKTLRTEILSGNLIYDKKAFGHGFWPASKVKVIINLVRRFYWEDNSETTLDLTNSAGTGSTADVHGTDDATYENWFTIASADIEGSLEAPVHLTVENRNASLGRTRTRMWLCNDEEIANTLLEAEDGTYDAGATPTAGAGASDGNYLASTAWVYWPTSVVADTYKGQWYHVVGLFFSFPTDGTVVQLRIQDNVSADDLFVPEALVLNDQSKIQYLGLARIPPRAVRSGTMQGVRIRLEFDTDVDLDMVQLMSTKRGHRYYSTVGDGTNWGLGDDLVDSPYEDEIYIDNAGGNIEMTALARGRRIHVVPGQDNKFIVLSTVINANKHDWEIAYDLRFTVKYRPRFLSV